MFEYAASNSIALPHVRYIMWLCVFMLMRLKQKKSLAALFGYWDAWLLTRNNKRLFNIIIVITKAGNV